MGDTRNATTFTGSSNAGTQIGQVLGNVEATVNNYYGKGHYSSSDATAFVQSLSSNYRRQKDLNPPRVSSTCEWFLADDRFLEWRDAEDARLLHVFAGPGCGKSVLSRALIDEKLVKNAHTSTVLYFFFKTAQGDQDKATSALTSMLHQIYSQHRGDDLKIPALAQYQLHGKNLCNLFDELWDVFLATIELIQGSVACVVDALDECEEDDRRLLISAISRYYEERGNNGLKSNLKFLITSRPYAEVRFEIDAANTLTSFVLFDGDEKSDVVAVEINHVIEKEITRGFRTMATNFRVAIIKHLQSMNNRTYLWLHLIIGHIKQNIAGHRTEKKVKKLIQELPDSVDKAYNDMLCRSPSPKTTKRLLSIVLAAERPLTTQELCLALELSSCAYTTFDEVDNEDEQQFRDTLEALCGLLLSVYNSSVYFLHETAREFLLCQDGSISSIEGTWRHSIHIQDAETVMATTCITLLNLKDLKESRPKLGELKVLDRWANLNRYGIEKALPFLLYAAANWALHYRKSKENLPDEMFESLLSVLSELSTATCLRRLLEVESPTLAKLHYTPDDTGPLVQIDEFRYFSTLIIASGEGCSVLVERIIGRGGDVNKTCGIYGTCLHATVRGGYEETTQMLLSHGANPFIEDSHQNDAFYLAALMGRDSILQLLLVHVSTKKDREPLKGKILWAAARNNSIATTTIRTLLDCGAGSAVTNYQFLNMAEHVLLYSHVDRFKLLLDHRTECAGGFPLEGLLFDSIRFGKTEHFTQAIIKLYGSELKRNAYEVAIERAAEHNNKRILQILLRSSEESIEAGNSVWESALKIAVTTHHGQNVQLLLEDPRLELETERLGYMIEFAVRVESKDTLKKLLDHGIQKRISIEEGSYREIIDTAIERYNNDVLNLLLTHAAIKDKLDVRTYAYVLSEVLFQGRQHRVRIVLDGMPADFVKNLGSEGEKFEAAVARADYLEAGLLVSWAFYLAKSPSAEKAIARRNNTEGTTPFMAVLPLPKPSWNPFVDDPALTQTILTRSRSRDTDDEYSDEDHPGRDNEPAEDELVNGSLTDDKAEALHKLVDFLYKEADGTNLPQPTTSGSQLDSVGEWFQELNLLNDGTSSRREREDILRRIEELKL